MPDDFQAMGTILRLDDGVAVFAPAGTRYELRLQTTAATLPVGKPIKAGIRVAARKVLTVCGGGNFITPIQGPPRILQGWIVQLEERTMVLNCGVPIVVALPLDQGAYDLTHGALAVGQRANVAAQAGATLVMGS